MSKKTSAWIFGGILALLVVTYFVTPVPTTAQWRKEAFFMATVAAFLAAFGLGTMTFKGKVLGNTVTAGGGLAVFLVVFLILTNKPEIAESQTPSPSGKSDRDLERDMRNTIQQVSRLVETLQQTQSTKPPTVRPYVSSPLVLIYIDGFRWDYLTQYLAKTKTLRQLMTTGASARRLIPVFPSSLLPTSYSMVTGLYPSSHGMVNDQFYEGSEGRRFALNIPVISRESGWWGGEPIWVTAIKQGRVGAASFWPGSETAINGVRPTYWRVYDATLSFQKRLEDLVIQIGNSSRDRDPFMAVYLGDVKEAARRFGPISDQTAMAVELCDTQVAAIVSRLENDGHTPNYIIVSGSGMTETNKDQVNILDDYVDSKSVMVDYDGAVTGLRALTIDVEQILSAVSKVPHARAFRSENAPRHLRLTAHPRYPSVFVLSDPGWQLVTRSTYKRYNSLYTHGYPLGSQGYDPREPDMHGFLIAYGPSFRQRIALPEADCVDIYNLMCSILRLRPANNEGDDDLIKELTR